MTSDECSAYIRLPTYFDSRRINAQSLNVHSLLAQVTVKGEVAVSIAFILDESSVDEVMRLPGGGCVIFGSVSDLWHFR